MKKSLLGLVTVCLVGGLVVGDAWARGPRGGRARGGMRAGGGAAMRGPASSGPRNFGSHASPGQRMQPAAGPSASGPRSAGATSAARSGNASRMTPQSFQQLLGGTQPNPAERSQQVRSQASQRAEQARTTAAEWANQWTSTHPEPFTPAWYAEHPQAWHYTHPHADAAIVATTAGIAAWLAAPLAAAGASGGGYYYESSEVALTEEPAEESAEESSEQSPPAEESMAAPQLVPASSTELNDEAPWMPLGVFQLKTAADAKADRAIQLAVGQDGQVRGTHYDIISNDVDEIYGSIDKQTLQVTWKVGASSQVVFEAPLDELTKDEGRVTLHQPNGTTETWVTLRVTQ